MREATNEIKELGSAIIIEGIPLVNVVPFEIPGPRTEWRNMIKKALSQARPRLRLPNKAEVELYHRVFRHAMQEELSGLYADAPGSFCMILAWGGRPPSILMGYKDEELSIKNAWLCVRTELPQHTRPIRF